jgi:hypothetical protein
MMTRVRYGIGVTDMQGMAEKWNLKKRDIQFNWAVVALD